LSIKYNITLIITYYSDLLPPEANVNPSEWHKSTRRIPLPWVGRIYPRFLN